MNVPHDPELRELEILQAIGQGARTYTDIYRHSRYENLSSVRRLCTELVRTHHLEMWMTAKPRIARNFSPWRYGPRACHFRLTPEGETRLSELEREPQSRSVETAS